MAGKKERQRKLARERYERRMARQAQRQQSVRRTTKIVSVVVVLVAVAAVVTFTVLNLTSGPNAAALPSATPTTAATPTPTPTVAEPAHHCVYAPTPGQQAARKVGVPPATPNWKAKYRATITTNRGPIVIDLLNSKATCTVNSFVYLASKGYFGKTHCHRLTTSGIYVLQCGDPTGTGTGGPGYEFADENLAGATYPAGIVAMAHSSLPNSNGSQFFLVYKNTSLPPSYTPFGTVVSGLKVLMAVAKAGTDNANGPGDGHPKLPVIIEKVTITKA